MKVGDLVRYTDSRMSKWLGVGAEYGIVKTIRMDGDVIVVMTSGRYFIDRAERFQVVSSCNH